MLSARIYRTASIFFMYCIGGVFNSYAQKPAEILQRAANTRFLEGKNDSPSAIQVPVAKEISSFSKNAMRQIPVNATVRNTSKREALSACKDSSCKKIFFSGTLTYNLFCSAKTNAGGIISGGSGRNYPDPAGASSKAVLSKVPEIIILPSPSSCITDYRNSVAIRFSSG